jgi:hypothetical protein
MQPRTMQLHCYVETGTIYRTIQDHAQNTCAESVNIRMDSTQSQQLSPRSAALTGVCVTGVRSVVQ